MRIGIAAGCGMALALALLAAGCLRDAPSGAGGITAAPDTLAAGSATAVVFPAKTAVVTPIVEIARLPTTAPTQPADAPAPLPTPVPAPDDPPTRDLYAAAIEFGATYGDGGTPARTIPADPECCQEGHKQHFYIADSQRREVYGIDATLRVVSENAYWYVDDRVDVSEGDLREAAAEFERRIRPAIVGAIGDIWTPGVDGDPRLTVLHTPLNDALGYFGASDEYPRAIHPYSNGREMIYMGIRPGSAEYLRVLAHEFQHAVHWHLDSGEDSWVDEGMAETAAYIAVGRLDFAAAFLRKPEIQLNYWPNDPYATAAHYGATGLFIGYIAQRCGGYAALGELAREQADGVNGIDRYLSSRCGLSFDEVFADWVIANYLDAPADEHGGIYGYADHSVRIRQAVRVRSELDETRAQPQLSARYYDIQLPQGTTAIIEFEGDAFAAQTAAGECRSGRRCWWSGAGDAVHAYLEREFDLSGLTEATLSFWMWSDIEEDWDYGYVSVSTDGGANRTLLKGRHTTTADPLGNNFGSGITGASGGWVRELMDLTPYAGEASVLLRFEYITDEAVNFDGWLLDDISIPELGFADDAESADGWRAAGFRHTDNTLPQTYVAQLIEIGMDGAAFVRRMLLAPDGNGKLRGGMPVWGFGERIERAVLVVSPTAHGTYRPAEYRVRVWEVDE